MQANATARFTLVGSFVCNTIFTVSNENKYYVIESVVAAAPFHQVSNKKSGQLRTKHRITPQASVVSSLGGGLLDTVNLVHMKTVIKVPAIIEPSTLITMRSAFSILIE